MRHQTHASVAHLKQIWDQAALDAQARPCPNPECKVRGRKDENCTHMTCQACNTLWCYFCGEKVEDCDKATDAELVAWYGGNGDPDMAPEYRHTHGWSDNGKRCPMYFNQLHEVDNSWPEDDTACLNKYHGLLAHKFLFDAYQQIGEGGLRHLIDAYGESIVTGTGFEVDEVQTNPGQIGSWINASAQRRATLPREREVGGAAEN